VTWWAWIAIFAGVALLGSIGVAAQRPGRGRDATAWIGAITFYVVLVSFFATLTRGALAKDSTAGIVGFGFLVTFFSIGLVLAVVKLITFLRGGTARDTSATH
jgi:hypothetical protein